MSERFRSALDRENALLVSWGSLKSSTRGLAGLRSPGAQSTTLASSSSTTTAAAAAEGESFLEVTKEPPPSQPGMTLRAVLATPISNYTSLGARAIEIVTGPRGEKTLEWGTTEALLEHMWAPGLKASGASSATGFSRRRISVWASPSSPSVITASPTPVAPTSGPQSQRDSVALDVRSLVRDNVSQEMIYNWDAFLLSHRDVLTTEALIVKLGEAFAPPPTRKPVLSASSSTNSVHSVSLASPVATRQNHTSFQTGEGNHVVCFQLDEELPSSLTRNARAILANLRLPRDPRPELKSIEAMEKRLNVGLFALYWLRLSVGLIQIASCADPMDVLSPLVFTVNAWANYEPTEEPSAAELAVLAVIRNVVQLINVQFDLLTSCEYDVPKIGRALGVDLDGSFLAAIPDADFQFVRQHALCFANRPLPRWALPLNATIFTKSPQAIAVQLTLFTFDVAYRHIHACMFFGVGPLKNDPSVRAEPVRNMVRIFNVLGSWTLGLLVEPGLNIKARLQRFTFLIAVAEHLRRLGNYHCVFAICGGITQPNLAWLVTALSDTSKSSVLKSLEELKRLISPKNDYVVYRADISKLTGRSCIPFLGVANRTLAKIDADEATSASNPGLMHFARLIAKRKCVDEFLKGHQLPYVAKGGRTYALVAGPPGPSPYGPPTNSPSAPISNGTEIFNAASVPSSNSWVMGGNNTELLHDDDLVLMLAKSLANTLTEEGLRENNARAKEETESFLSNQLIVSGFMS